MWLSKKDVKRVHENTRKVLNRLKFVGHLWKQTHNDNSLHRSRRSRKTPTDNRYRKHLYVRGHVHVVSVYFERTTPAECGLNELLEILCAKSAFGPGANQQIVQPKKTRSLEIRRHSNQTPAHPFIHRNLCDLASRRHQSNRNRLPQPALRWVLFVCAANSTAPRECGMFAGRTNVLFFCFYMCVRAGFRWIRDCIRMQSALPRIDANSISLQPKISAQPETRVIGFGKWSSRNFGQTCDCRASMKNIKWCSRRRWRRKSSTPLFASINDRNQVVCVECSIHLQSHDALIHCLVCRQLTTTKSMTVAGRESTLANHYVFASVRSVPCKSHWSVKHSYNMNPSNSLRVPLTMTPSYSYDTFARPFCSFGQWSTTWSTKWSVGRLCLGNVNLSGAFLFQLVQYIQKNTLAVIILISFISTIDCGNS